MKKDTLPVPKFLTVPEAGRICGVSRNTVYNWVKKGVLDAYQTPGRTNLIRPGDLLIFMRENGMFVPEMLAQLATADAEHVGFVPKSEVDPKPKLPTVIYVDDDEKDQSLVKRALHKKAEVLVAKTGYEALHILTLEENVSLVIVAGGLKGLSADETIVLIEKDHPDIPLVAVSSKEAPVKASSRLVDTQVSKPLRLRDVDAIFRKIRPEVG